MTADAVAWHDLECGGYAEDLPLWRELAADAGGPVLDVGAGTGRVALDLARAGHEVVALDTDATLLAALRRRAAAAGLPVEAVEGDARTFTLDREFALILAPMQTVQLLRAGGPEAFLRRARAHLRPGGLVACALAEPVLFDEDDPPPTPDLREAGGWVLSSLPTAARDAQEPGLGGAVWLERRRETVAPDGVRSVTLDRVLLDRVSLDELHAAARAAGLEPLAPRVIAATAEHVGSEVAMLRG